MRGATFVRPVHLPFIIPSLHLLISPHPAAVPLVSRQLPPGCGSLLLGAWKSFPGAQTPGGVKEQELLRGGGGSSGGGLFVTGSLT